MSFIKHEDDTQSNVSMDLSRDYCEDDSLLQATDFRHSFANDTKQPLSEEVFYTKPSLNLLDGKFFQYIPEKSTNNKLVAFCMKCYPLAVEVKGCYGSCTSNFISHLKRRHGDEMVTEYREYMKSKRRRVNYDQISSGSVKAYQQQNKEYASESSPTITQQKKFMTHKTLEKPNAVATLVPNLEHTSSDFVENAVNFFISSLIPTKVIENRYFKKIFQDLKLPEEILQTMTCKSLEENIKQRYQHTIATFTHKINESENHAVSLHLWNSGEHFFIGLVVHWLELDLRRNSSALAVRKIEKKNLNADSIEGILEEFNESLDRTQAILIGNVRNYLQEYIALGLDISNVVYEQSLGIENNIYCDASNVPFEPVLSKFPAQLSCPAFTLNKALRSAFTDMFAATNNTALSAIHMSVIAHCNSQWKTMRANNLSQVTRPLFNNWRSLFESLEHITTLNQKSQQLPAVANMTLLQNELSYIHEFLICTSPITDALNILQNDSNSYFGIVLPCLFALKRKLQKVRKSQNLLYCQPLLDSYLSIISNYFQEYYELKSQSAQNAAIAALSYPRFKNQWFVCLEQPEHRAEILQHFKKAIGEHMTINPNIKVEPVEHQIDFSDSFFDFSDDIAEEATAAKQKSKSQISLENMVEAQVSQFFAEESPDISILNQYPEIKKVFMQYNTPLASLAFGEEFFSSTFMNTLEKNHKQFNPLVEARLILKAHLDGCQY